LRFRPDHQVISLVSALSLLSLSDLVAPAVRIARAVPLPSAANRLSPTAIYPPDPEAFEVFSAFGTVFPVERENEFDAICATTATIAFYLGFNERLRLGWSSKVFRHRKPDYIARLFFGVTTGAIEASERSFQSLAATHATAGGINEQFFQHMVEHGLLTRVSEGLDAVLHRIGVA